MLGFFVITLDAVIVNGQVVVHQGRHLGAKPGKILRPEREV